MRGSTGDRDMTNATNATREQNVLFFIETKKSLAEYGWDAEFHAEVKLALKGVDKGDHEKVAQVLQHEAHGIWGQIQAEWAEEAYQDDIDSGWAAERAALDRAHNARYC
jgi:hypothetical protein